MQLREYQQDIINQVINSEISILIQIPTGGGKTIIASEIIKHAINAGLQVLFVVPLDTLMNQSIETFKKAKLNPYKLHGRNKNHYDEQLVVSTLQTVYKEKNFYPDIIIIDEIHYGYDGIMIESLKQNTIKYNIKSRLIGLSATPYDKFGRKLKGFDLVLDKYDLEYMIKNNYLVDVECHVLTNIRNLNKVKIVAGDYDLSELSTIVCDDKLIMNIVYNSIPFIQRAIKTIVFAVDINHAELLNRAYKSLGINSSILHSKIDTPKDIEINKFKNNEIDVLISVRMLTTGFDVPETDLAIIARPTKSQNLYKQMVGRILRISNNKTHAVLLDAGNVIKELGNPLEPIKERNIPLYSNKMECDFCGSNNIKKVQLYNQSFWKCQQCNDLKPIKDKVYTCKNCNQNYNSENVKIKIFNDALFMHCIKCNSHTNLSEYDIDIQLKKVKDASINTNSLISIESKLNFNDQELIKKAEELLLKSNKLFIPCKEENLKQLKIEYKESWTYGAIKDIIKFSSEKFLLKFTKYLASDYDLSDDIEDLLSILIEYNETDLFKKTIKISEKGYCRVSSFYLSYHMKENTNDEIIKTIYKYEKNNICFYHKIIEINKVKLVNKLLEKNTPDFNEIVNIYLGMNYDIVNYLLKHFPNILTKYDLTELFRRLVQNKITFFPRPIEQKLDGTIHSDGMKEHAKGILDFLNVYKNNIFKLIIDDEYKQKAIDEIILYDNLPYFKILVKVIYKNNIKNLDDDIRKKIERNNPKEIITYINSL